MKKLVPVLALATVVPFAAMPLPALAAPPASFTATGMARMHASGKTPETQTPVKVFYQQGMVRIELSNPDYGDSVVLAQRGKPTLTLMDPKQKVAFTVRPDAVPQNESQLPVQQLVDLTNWKGLLQKEGKRLAGKETKAGQACSLWQTTQGQTTTKIWFADALELPMQIESSVQGKPRFTFTVQAIDTKGALGANLFRVPAGFTHADLE